EGTRPAATGTRGRRAIISGRAELRGVSVHDLRPGGIAEAYRTRTRRLVRDDPATRPLRGGGQPCRGERDRVRDRQLPGLLPRRVPDNNGWTNHNIRVVRLGISEGSQVLPANPAGKSRGGRAATPEAREGDQGDLRGVLLPALRPRSHAVHPRGDHLH